MFSLNFSSTTVLLGLVALCAGTGLSIYLLRRIVLRKSVLARTNLEHHRAMFSLSEPIHGLGLCVAIAASVLTINWTQPNAGQPTFEIEPGELEVIETHIPPTPYSPPPPPPPPPPVVEALPDELIEDTPPFESMDVDPEDEVLPPAPPAPPSPAPPAAPATPAERAAAFRAAYAHLR
ncbi:hypothetical protein [Lewinella sp. 4G2]|uniref:hypothetical protein n=1 Tax=Lewinella sp. 4G2 TaxID=1803372 RepID=UPI0007E1AD53|nr:hypothetical protein [Lewinella sp. 4G2]OAV44431.1 hypothetical protein A3850_007960 [Lewinella sp. 4G2]